MAPVEYPKTISLNMTEEISAASVYAPFACPVVFFTVWPRIPVNTVYTCQSISKYAYLAKIIRNFGNFCGQEKFETRCVGTFAIPIPRPGQEVHMVFHF